MHLGWLLFAGIETDRFVVVIGQSRLRIHRYLGFGESSGVLSEK